MKGNETKGWRWHDARRLSTRLFGVFIACAMLPLFLYAALSHYRAVSLLEERAFDRLRSDLSLYGNSVVDRIHVVESDLVAVWEGLAPAQLRGDQATTPPQRVQDHFASITLLDGDRVLGLFGQSAPLATTRDFLEEGSGISFLVREGHRGHALFAGYRKSPADPILVVEIDANYLWGLDAVDETTALAVFDEEARALVPDQPPPPLLMREAASHMDRGVLTWRVDDEDHVATVRRLFTAPQIGINFLIVRGERRSDILDPARDLSRLLVIVGIATLLLIALVSRRWIGRTLRPIEALRRATVRVAAGDLDTSLTIASRDEIGDLGHAFNSMTEELRANRDSLVAARDAARQTARIQGDFIQNVSHELRTPVTCVVAAAEILESFAPDAADGSGEFLQIVADQSRKLRTLIDDIIGYTEVQAERHSVSDQTVDVMATIIAAVDDSRKRCPSGVTIEVAAGTQLPRVRGSEYRLGELWTRLLDNAIKFGPEPGLITVRARVDQGRVVVEIEDEGEGVPERDREAVFEPFRQSSDDMVTDKPPGTGVGLSISREIVARHRGAIVFDGAPGGGALLRVTLPCAADSAPLTVTPLAASPEPVEAAVGP